MTWSQERRPRGASARVGLIAGLVCALAGAAWVAWRLCADEGAPTRRQTHEATPAPPVPEPIPVVAPETQPIVPPEPLAAAPEPGAIRGSVVDRGGIALNHATVRFELRAPPGQRNFALVATYDETVPVDERGTFSHLVPGGGIYRVVAQAEGFAPAVREGVKPGDEVELMLDVGATITGFVHDQNTEQPIEGATIVVQAKVGDIKRTATTSATGEFTLSGLAAGEHAIAADHEFYVAREGLPQKLDAGEIARIRIALDGGKSIKGTVTAEVDGRTIADARIMVAKKKAKTDERGRFHVRGLASIVHGVQIAAEGYQGEHRSVNLSGSRTEALVEVQLKEGATIRGRVQTEQGVPVVGAAIKLFESWGEWKNEDWMTRHLDVKTAEDGTFKMTGLVTWEWRRLAVRVQAQGYPDTFEEGIRLTRPDDDVMVVITLRDGAVVAGRVVDQENRPVSGARVEIRKQNTHGWWVNGNDPNVTVSGTDAAGEFRFQGLGKGRYALSAHVRGFSSAYKGDIDMTSSPAQSGITLTVEQGSPVTGIVVTSLDKPVAGAQLWVWTRNGSGTAVSGPDGRFTVESLPKPPYDVYASAVGFGQARMKGQVPVDGIGLRVELKSEAVLKGTAVDARTKKPVTPCYVALTQEGGQSRYGTEGQDKDGAFQLQAPSGTYTLEVTAPGYVKATKEGITLTAGQDPDPITMEMKKGGAIEGIVRMVDGQVQPWVEVYAQPSDENAPMVGGVQNEHDGYFYIGDLDSDIYSVVFVHHTAPPLVVPNVMVGGDKPAYVEAQLQIVARLWFDFEMERPKPRTEEVVASANGATPNAETPVGATAARPPQVRAWVENRDRVVVQVENSWTNTGPEFRRSGKKWIGTRQPQWQPFSAHVHDLPAGRYVFHATALGFENVEIPFTVQQGEDRRIAVKLTPREDYWTVINEQQERRHGGRWRGDSLHFSNRVLSSDYEDE